MISAAKQLKLGMAIRRLRRALQRRNPPLAGQTRIPYLAEGIWQFTRPRRRLEFRTRR
jgi:hypothetical protein